MQRLLAFFSLVLAVSVPADSRVPPGSESEIRDRLTPFGSICKVGDACGGGTGPSASGSTRTGQQIYDKSCFICHGAGVGGAPIFNNNDDWAPRVAKGVESLWNSTRNGLNTMPARGTCMDCSDDELRAAMDYMLDAL